MLWDFLWAPDLGPLLLEKGSEPWAPILKVAYSGVIVGLYGFRLEAHTRAVLNYT